jgi:ribonuclease-3
MEKIEKLLNYNFKNKQLLATAFVHRSYINENKQVVEHNERLEFLGDSVLGLVVSDFLFRALPGTAEGELSSLRARLIEASSCNKYLLELGVESYLLLGKGERYNDGRGRETILADLFEAIVGAIYLDGGFEAAHKFILSHFSKKMDSIAEEPTSNWKALLQDHCQRQFQEPPTYVVLSESGPDHSKTFVISVQIEGDELGQGTGSSKKTAQQAAAQDAVRRMNLAR